MQTDPIGYADGMNWYAYVGNDPVNKVDPLGLTGDMIFVDGQRREDIDAGRAELDAGLNILSLNFDIRDTINNTIVVSARRPSRPEVYGPLQYGPQGVEPNLEDTLREANELVEELCKVAGQVQETGTDVLVVGGAIIGIGLLTPFIPDGELIGVGVGLVGAVVYGAGRIGEEVIPGCSV